jgi:DnaK suppressor protein
MLNHEQMKLALLTKAKELNAIRPSKDQIVIEQAAELIDAIQGTMDRELSLDLMSRNWSTAQLVASALDRLNSGCYGTCQHCEEPISERRLQAIPWAEFCRDCQELADQAGDSHDLPLAA